MTYCYFKLQEGQYFLKEECVSEYDLIPILCCCRFVPAYKSYSTYCIQDVIFVCYRSLQKSHHGHSYFSIKIRIMMLDFNFILHFSIIINHIAITISVQIFVKRYSFKIVQPLFALCRLTTVCCITIISSFLCK